MKDIQISSSPNKQLMPYVPVDFTWFFNGRNVDPNSMDTIYIQDAIQSITRLVDDGNKSEIEGERMIKGFREILATRLSGMRRKDSVIYTQLKEMEDPLLSVLDKSTGEVVDLDLIPYSVLLDLVKKYYQ